MDAMLLMNEELSGFDTARDIDFFQHAVISRESDSAYERVSHRAEINKDYLDGNGCE